MTDKVGAYGTKASEASFRKKWDTEAYAAKSKATDLAAYEHHVASEAAIATGKKPPKASSSSHRGPDLPKPTKALEARGFDLEIEKNLNKTVLVAGGSKGGPGFYCELCRRTLKDSIAYLDHVNGRSHLAHLGQTTQVRRSTLQQVKDRIALLRAQTETKVTSKNFDFEERLRVAREEEERLRVEKKEGRKRKREAAKSGGGGAARPASSIGESAAAEKKPKLSSTAGTGVNNTAVAGGGGAKMGTNGAFGDDRRREAEEAEMAGFMGFGGFGGGVKKR